MTTLIASAPGKLVLSGEYAVLDGAAALSMAVDRRAVVTVKPLAGEHHAVMAPGFSDSKGLFDGYAGELSWHAGGEGLALFEKVWAAARISSQESLSFTLDTNVFRENGVKIGVGSSAALAVALAKAMCTIGGGDSAGVAKKAHHDFQGGAGSGVDIATSQAGGIIEYRTGDTAVSGLSWPAGLHYAVFWSGVAADTRSRIERLQEQPATVARAALGDAADQFATVFREGSVSRILDELGRYKDALYLFDAEYDLGIFAAGHAGLVDAAPAHGVAYKPCGAGGGDVGIALAAAEDSLASFRGAAETLGFRCLDMHIDLQGVMLTEEEQ